MAIYNGSEPQNINSSISHSIDCRMKYPTSILMISRRLDLEHAAPKCNINLALELSKYGCEVHILTSFVNANVMEALLKNNVKLHIVHHISKYIDSLFYTYIARRIKNKFDINIVVGNGYTIGDDITWIHLPRYAYVDISHKLGYSIPPKLRIEAEVERIILKTSKYLLAPSNLTKKTLTNLYGYSEEKIIIVPHGVDIKYYKPLTEEERGILKSKLDLDDKLILLFVGNSSPYKGLHILLKEISFINHRNEILLFVAGVYDHEVRGLLRKLDLEKIVQPLGLLNAEKLKVYYQLADLFVLPSLYETFSMSTLEAMACGAVPVVSLYAGVSEIIKTDVNGYIIDPLQRGNIASVIEKLIAYPYTKIQSLRRAANATAFRYSWANVAKMFLCKVLNLLG